MTYRHIATRVEWFDEAGTCLGTSVVPGNATYVAYDPVLGSFMPLAPEPPAGTTLAPSRPIVDNDDDLDHLTCAVCDPDMTTSLCGRDVTDLEFSDELPDLCVVCRDLEVCPRCGDKLDPWTAGGGA